MGKGQEVEERFLDKTEKVERGCLEWRSTIHRDGYGKFWLHGKNIQAHRAAWLIFKGEIPSELWVLHTCDNRKCVNLEHLYLGTASQNAIDKCQRFRGMWGSMKVPMETVEKCRELYASGMSQQAIADLFGIHQTQVSRYVRLTSRIPFKE